MEIQNWKDAYKEIALRINANIPAVKWIDLWHNQIGFLSEEHPFPAPAIFLSFRTLDTTDLGQKVQDYEIQIDFYVYYETFADTFDGSYNQQSALAFLQTLEDIHKFFHGFSGEHFSELRHTSFAPVDTGSAGNLYRSSFVCLMRGYNASTIGDNIESGAFSTEFSPEFDSDDDDEPLFISGTI